MTNVLRFVLVAASFAMGVGVSGCSPEVEEGHFACAAQDECPSGWTCREDRRCWRSELPLGPTRGGIVPLGGVHTTASGAVVVKDDGFELSGRACTASGTICASAGLTP
jgi:hypothetical protein